MTPGGGAVPATGCTDESVCSQPIAKSTPAVNTHALALRTLIMRPVMHAPFRETSCLRIGRGAGGGGGGPRRGRGPTDGVWAKVRGRVMTTTVHAHITGTVWKIEVRAGDRVEEGQVCVILESMKMEMPVESPRAGVVDKVHVVEGQSIAEGDPVVTLA